MAGDSWSETTLGAIALGDNGLVDGPFGSNLPASIYTAKGVPLIRGSNLSLGESRFNDREFVYVSDETAARLRRSICQPGDIVFTKKGTIGQTGFVPLRGRFDRYLLSSNQMKLSVDPEKADSLFVYYAVSSPEGREKVVRDASITGVPKTNVAYLREFPIRLPPLRDQRAIVHILGTLDDKIELNQRMNETLEAMARAIFQSWFVDFDPVRGKAEGLDPGLPKDVVDLFPDRLVDSELGEIPEGWEVKKLSALCSTQYGYTASAVNEPIGPKFLRVTDINKRNWIEWGDVPHCTIDPDLRASYALEVGDLVVARMADPGKSAIIEEEIDAVFASYLVRLKTPSLAHSYYVYGFLKSGLYADYAERATSGSVQANMNAKVIVGASVVVPPKAVMEQFLRAVLPLRWRIVSNVKESCTLAALRDTLLPKLISAELRVKDAKRFADQAT
jgi:type I restriction enzyme S subunit